MIDISKLKVSETEYYDASIERIANEANNTNEYGQKRLSARELKRRLMKPTDLLKNKFNALCDALNGLDGNQNLTEESIAGLIQTGIASHPTLYDLFVGFNDGTLIEAIVVREGETLGSVLKSMEKLLEAYRNGELNSASSIVYLGEAELETL